MKLKKNKFKYQGVIIIATKGERDKKNQTKDNSNKLGIPCKQKAC